MPNYKDPNNRYNYVFNSLQKQNTTQLTVRLDYNFSDSTKAYVRLAQDDGQVDQQRGIWWNSSDYALPTTINNTQLGRSAALNLTSVLSPTVTNEVLFTFSKLKLDNIHADESKISLSGLGINGYGGFFGAGIGIMMLAALAVLGLTDIHQMNGLKNLLAILINGVAAVYFMIKGAVLWTDAILMAVASIGGGLGGASLANRLGRPVVRKAVIAVGIAASVSLLLKFLGG